jgi:MarR family transcriptional regulator for hemolysin
VNQQISSEPSSARIGGSKGGAVDAYSRLFPEGSRHALNFRFTRTFRLAFRSWRHILEGRLRTFGITRAKWSVLSSIVLSGEGRTQNELAKQLGIEGPTLVRLLDGLEGAKLLSREPSPTDRRAKLIIATPEGRELAERLVQETKDARVALLSNLSEDDIVTLTTLLEKLLRRDD